MPDLSKEVRALQLNVEGLMKLLGGTRSDREVFWEKLKGITTPAEFELIRHQINTTNVLTKQIQAGAKTLQSAASKISRSTARTRR
jgi:hypothetical protein